MPGAALIRPGRDADGPGVIALIGACWAEYPGLVMDVDAELPEIRAFASHVAAKGGALWVAEQEGRVVGMVATYPTGDAWELSRLYVAAGERGTGLGARLLHLAQDHARAAGATRMALWSDVKFTRAHAFYEKHGWVRRGGLRALHDLSDTIEAGYAKPLAGLVVELLDAAAAESAERALVAVLCGCVNAGASVSFIPPLDASRAAPFWRRVSRSVAEGHTLLWAAWLDGALVGTVQLGLDTPENQPHRVDLKKMLVAPSARRRGVGRALMAAAEAGTRTAGRRLLVLDTEVGSPGEALYRAMGWSEAGMIPGYSLGAGGVEQATRYFYKTV